MSQVKKTLYFASQVNNGCSPSAVQQNALIVTTSNTVTFNLSKMPPDYPIHFILGLAKVDCPTVELFINDVSYGILTYETREFIVPRATSYTIKAGGVNTGMPLEFSIFACSDYVKYANYIEYYATEPSASDLNLSGHDISQGITCSWNASDVESWTMQVIQNGIVKATKTGTTLKSCTFNPTDINATGETAFKLTYSGYGTTSSIQTTVTLTAPIPSISNEEISGTSVDVPITCTANCTNTDRWTVDYIQNDKVICSKSGTGNVNATFAIGETKEGKSTFRITAYNTWTSSTDNINTTLVAPQSSVSDYTVTGTSIDTNISVSATGTNVYNWTVEAIQDGIVKSTKAGTGNNISCTFPKGSLVNGGNTTFKLTYSNTWNSGNTEISRSLSYTQATISLLELPSSNINTDNPFTITWVSINQSSFALKVGDRTYTGTTQTSVTVPGGIIGKGIKYVELTINYTGSYYSNSDTTTSSFNGYGKPSTPVLNISSSYSSANPVLQWSSSDQVVYQVVIKHVLTQIEDSGQVTSTNKYYLVNTSLSNNTTYTVTLKVKNVYGLWSDEVQGTFTVQFTMPNIPTIQAISDITTGSIVLTVNTDVEDDTEYKNTEIWKREPNGDWKRMAYKLQSTDLWQDFYVAGGVDYEYKARNTGKSGGFSESSIIKTSTVVNGYNFYDVQNGENFMRFETGEPPKPKINQNVVSNKFAGAKAPTNHSDDTKYWTCSMQFDLNDRDDVNKLYALLGAKLLLYKDNKGHKWFGNIVNSPDFSEDDVEIIKVPIEFVQSQFIEEDVYTGSQLELIAWDGGWKFDGTHIFGGE